MQLVLDYYIGEDHLVEKEPAFVQQALICGVTAAKNHWLYKKGSRPVRTYTPDGEVTRMNVEMQDLVFRDGPTFETWDMNRMFWAPERGTWSRPSTSSFRPTSARTICSLEVQPGDSDRPLQQRR
jgi:hypothetical protein